MSAKTRMKANQLADKYARVFAVPRATVIVELREDDDAEVYAPDVGVVWTLLERPYQTTKESAR